MYFIENRLLDISLLLVLAFSLLSKCHAVDFYDQEFDDFKRIVQNGLLNQMSERIALDDSGITENCAQDLLQWSQDFVSFKTWALKMLDAGGKPPHGLLQGNINSLGMFKECLGISHHRNDSRTIKGKYCLARIPLPTSILGINRNVLVSLNSMTPGVAEGNQRIANLGSQGIYFNLAVCLPASCKASDMETSLMAALGASNISTSISVPDDYCSEDEPRPWDDGEIIGVVVLGVVVCLVICGTLYDIWYRTVKKGDLKSMSLLTAFSGYTNSKRLTTLSKDPGPLVCIHGIRVLSICWIILGHRYRISFGFPMENSLDLYTWMTSYSAMSLVASTISVDTFFLLSGLLLSYIFFRRTDNKSLRDIPVMYLHRFLRLTPVLIMVLLLQITLFAKIGRGPFWKSLNPGIEHCKNNWWAMLLYVQNYVNAESMCLAQTWYLAVDMQLFILSPLLLFPILKNAKIGVIWVCAWILAALATVFTICYINEWMAASYTENVIESYLRYYLPTYTRAAPWLIGLLAGYHLRIWNLKEIKINKIVVCILWIASLATMLAIIYGSKPLTEFTHKFSYLEDTTYMAFSRTAWALAVLWVIVACASGYGGPVNWFLSLRLWEFMARISYSMYLIHIALITYFVSTTKTIPYFSNVTWIHESFGDLLITIVVSYFMVLAFESPVTVLEKALFATDEKKSTSQVNLVLDPEPMKRVQNEHPNLLIKKMEP